VLVVAAAVLVVVAEASMARQTQGGLPEEVLGGCLPAHYVAVGSGQILRSARCSTHCAGQGGSHRYEEDHQMHYLGR
jgi:hypothetical protein